MYPRSFLYKEAKSEHYTSSKKELCKNGEKAIWESRFTCFLFVFNNVIFSYWLLSKLSNEIILVWKRWILAIFIGIILDIMLSVFLSISLETFLSILLKIFI